ncbi:MAG: tetratricopeptide repeat protein [Thermodesulfovibrionales bacterium]|nr:tetratricopeptide repeat protein [Thermodesulfovibrionales bacterium]
MGKLALLVFVLFLGVLALFAVSNQEATTVTVPFGAAYGIPKISLILFSAAFGALSVLVVFLIRDARRFIATYQFQRKRKKEDRIHELYSKAMNAILANDAPEAKDSLQKILEEEPAHADALLRLGDIASKEESTDEALGYYRRALASSKEGLEPLFSLSKVMETMGRWAEALGHIEEMLERDPDNLSALYKKRSLIEREGKWEELIDVQKIILKHANTEKEKQREHSNLLGYKYEQARDSLEKGGLERANKEFRAIIRMDKNFIPAYLGLAEAMLREGEAEDAVNFLEKAYEQASSQIILARLEDIMINIGEPSRLIRIYKTAISKSQQNSSLNNMLKFFLGKLYYRLEMVDDAFETLMSVDTDSYAELYQLLGELYLRRQQCEKAVVEFKKTISMKRSFRLPYCCTNCGHMSEEWSGRCPDCGSWNTYQFNLHGTCKA